MACIVGLVEQGVIYLGGDSISVSSCNKTLNRDSKVFLRNGIFFGTCGHTRLRNLLQYRLDIPPYRDTGPMTYLVNELLEAIRSCFKQEGFAQEDKGREYFEGRILLGLEHELYIIGGDYNISRPAGCYCAIGVGEEYAYGSLYTTEQMRVEPLGRLRMALEAAAFHNTDVSAPFTFVTSERGTLSGYQRPMCE